MFEYLKNRFGLDEHFLKKLLGNEDTMELLKDYELLFEQSQKFAKGTDQSHYYQGLLFELEEEIVDLIISVQESTNDSYS